LKGLVKKGMAVGPLPFEGYEQDPFLAKAGMHDDARNLPA